MRPLVGTLALACLLLAGTIPARAQVTRISGTVTDSATGSPLPGAHVFIASSQYGTITGSDGSYTLESIPPGAHRLYFSMLGFEPVAVDSLFRARAYTIDMAMSEKVIEIGEVTVEAEGDPNWAKYFERFKRLFLGESANALEVSIQNPEVLDFSDKLGRFQAYASAPLIIENRALGYRIQYFLNDFVATSGRTQYDGEPLFEELASDNPDDAIRWEEKRAKAFTGSFRHFLLALMAGRLEPQGFKVYNRPAVSVQGDPAGAGAAQQLSSQARFPISDPSTIFRRGDSPDEFILGFSGFVEITFMGEIESEAFLDWQRRGPRAKAKFQTSWINLENGPTIFDYKGDVLDPYGVTFYGYLAFERVADQVPKEYRPGQRR